MYNLAIHEPHQLLNQFHHELERFFGQEATKKPYQNTQWTPLVDIQEDKQNFYIEADMPGIEIKDIEIATENNRLIIKGERKTEKTTEESDKTFKRIERSYGQFYREFTLPDSADVEHITANGKNGVLTVTIPKKAVAQPRKIKIEVV